MTTIISSVHESLTSWEGLVEDIVVGWDHDWQLDRCFLWPLLCFLAYFALEKEEEFREGGWNYHQQLLWVSMHIFARLCLPTHIHTHAQKRTQNHQLRLKNLCIILLGENMLWALSRAGAENWEIDYRTHGKPQNSRWDPSLHLFCLRIKLPGSCCPCSPDAIQFYSPFSSAYAIELEMLRSLI